MNSISVIGRLTKDPDMKVVDNGVTMTRLTLAVGRSHISSEGIRKADFVPVTAFRGLGETCGRNLKKGALIGVSGSLQSRTFHDDDGESHFRMEVIAREIRFLEIPSDDDSNGEDD